MSTASFVAYSKRFYLNKTSTKHFKYININRLIYYISYQWNNYNLDTKSQLVFSRPLSSYLFPSKIFFFLLNCIYCISNLENETSKRSIVCNICALNKLYSGLVRFLLWYVDVKVIFTSWLKLYLKWLHLIGYLTISLQMIDLSWTHSRPYFKCLHSVAI